MSDLLQKVIQTVKEAGRITLDRDFSVDSKGDVANLVTTKDVEVQAFLQRKLTEIIPDSGFLGEENVNEKGNEYEWIVDPIDGTTNFIREIDDYSISVALKKNEEIILGVVYAPKTDDLYYADRSGAYHNGKPISVSNRPFNDSIICTAMSIYKKEYADVCNSIILETYKQCNDFRRFGSAALELCYLASGKCDLYFEIRVFAWDCAAGAYILRKAGGIVKTYNDEDLTYTKVPFVVIGANTEDNYKKISEIVHKHVKKKPLEN